MTKSYLGWAIEEDGGCILFYGVSRTRAEAIAEHVYCLDDTCHKLYGREPADKYGSRLNQTQQKAWARIKRSCNHRAVRVRVETL